jgi:tetratricopeptide (TPR) repeat protein
VPPFFQFARQQSSRRASTKPGQNGFTGSFWGNARILFRLYPLQLVLASGAILVGAFGMLYVNYMYQAYIIAAFHKYPEEVAKPLRKALYFTNYDPQPKEALKFYKQALLIAQEVGMHPFSDEVMGLRIQVAAFLEMNKQYKLAIDVLEALRTDNLSWLELYGEKEDARKMRTNILSKTIATSVKLGELYADPAIWDRDTAEARLVWAVESALKEKQRRKDNNVSDEQEGEWLDDNSLGAAIESLAHRYEATDQHYLASPLFLKALSLYPKPDCHAVVLMNNLASSIAQQSPRAALAVQKNATVNSIEDRPAGPFPTRESLLQSAGQWAQKALDVAATIVPPARTEECDMGCAVALHNLGEFAEMAKDVATAKKKYTEAISVARAVGFSEGVKASADRLKALAKAES